MSKRLVRWCFTSFYFLIVYALLFTPPVYAQDWLDPTGEQPAQFKDLEAVFGNILSVIFALAGFVVFAMLLNGGFRYLTAGGDPKATAQAKATLTWAIGGLILLIIAWFILRLIAQFTGVEQILQFQIGAE